MNLPQIWQAVLGELELSISKANFITWFKNTTIKEIRNGTAVILVPNVFTEEWLKNKYQKDIYKALNNITDNKIRSLEYKVGSLEEILKTQNQEIVEIEKDEITETENEIIEEKISFAARISSNGSLDPKTGLNPRYIFENFVVGSSNELAKAACLAVAENPGSDYNPLFIYGGVGLGKTHLVQAVGNHILKKHPNKKTIYVSSDRFTKGFIDSLQNRQMDSFKNKYMDIDVFIIDDIQFLSGKTRTQEEFFHIFNDLYQADKQIILSSDRPPKAIPTLEDRLKSRFEAGMIADIGLPDLETRIAILKQKCKEREFNIEDDMIQLIAENAQQNIRELEGALKRIIAHCDFKKCIPTPDLISGVLSTAKGLRNKAITIKQILDAVSSFYDVKRAELEGASRKKDIVQPRQIAMFLMREEIKSSFPAIGESIGGRDHTTAMHAYEKIKKEFETNEPLKQEIELIKQKLYM